MVTAYWSVFSVTLAIVVVTFLKDRSISKSNLQDWGFVLTAALIWPITLPFIISHKLKAASTARQQRAKQHQALQTEPEAPAFPVG